MRSSSGATKQTPRRDCFNLSESRPTMGAISDKIPLGRALSIWDSTSSPFHSNALRESKRSPPGDRDLPFGDDREEDPRASGEAHCGTRDQSECQNPFSFDQWQRLEP